MDKKKFNLKALDVDQKKKQVKVAIAQVEDIDRDNDVFDPSAFDKTIKENGPKGSNEIWHLLDHTPRSFSALGKFSELGREGKYITGVSNYKESFAWREVAWPLYEAGDINQHSVGFETLVDEKSKDDNGPRIIKQVKLYEGSAVMWGAQPDTPTMAVVKSLMNLEDDRDITASEKIEEMIKKLKQERKGFNEEDFSLFIIELKRLQTLFEQKRVVEIFTEQKTPQLETTEPGHIEDVKKPTLPDVVKHTIECPKCKRHTYDTMEEKSYTVCHRCDAMFVRGGLFV